MLHTRWKRRRRVQGECDRSLACSSSWCNRHLLQVFIGNYDNDYTTDTHVFLPFDGIHFCNFSVHFLHCDDTPLLMHLATFASDCRRSDPLLLAVFMSLVGHVWGCEQFGQGGTLRSCSRYNAQFSITARNSRYQRYDMYYFEKKLAFCLCVTPGPLDQQVWCKPESSETRRPW